MHSDTRDLPLLCCTPVSKTFGIKFDLTLNEKKAYMPLAKYKDHNLIDLLVAVLLFLMMNIVCSSYCAVNTTSTKAEAKHYDHSLEKMLKMIEDILQTPWILNLLALTTAGL